MSFDEEHLGEHYECQREFELMQRTARAYAARLREAESIIGDISEDIHIFTDEMRGRILAFLAPSAVDGSGESQ